MTTEPRPKIKLEPNPTDRLLEGLAATGLLLLVLLPVIYYADLPDTIPQHFNGAGEADGFGPKGIIWLLPALGLGLFIMLSLINRVPHIFNYPVKITAENAEKQYRLATRLIRILKAVIMLIFCYICWGMIRGALSGNTGLGSAMLWLILSAVFGSLGWYMWAAFREKR